MNQQSLLRTELLFYTDSLDSWELLDAKLKKKKISLLTGSITCDQAANW